MASLTVAPVSAAPPRVSSSPPPSDSSPSSDMTQKNRRAAGDPNAVVAGADTASLAAAQSAAYTSLVAVRAIETPTYTPFVITPRPTERARHLRRKKPALAGFFLAPLLRPPLSIGLCTDRSRPARG